MKWLQKICSFYEITKFFMTEFFCRNSILRKNSFALFEPKLKSFTGKCRKYFIRYNYVFEYLKKPVDLEQPNFLKKNLFIHLGSIIHLACSSHYSYDITKSGNCYTPIWTSYTESKVHINKYIKLLSSF